MAYSKTTSYCSIRIIMGGKSISVTLGNFLPRSNTLWGPLLRRVYNACQAMSRPNFDLHVFSMLPASVLAKIIEKRWRLRVERELQKQGFAWGNLCNSPRQKNSSDTSGLGILHWLLSGVVYITADLGKLHSRIKIWGKYSRWFDAPK